MATIPFQRPLRGKGTWITRVALYMIISSAVYHVGGESIGATDSTPAAQSTQSVTTVTTTTAVTPDQAVQAAPDTSANPLPPSEVGKPDVAATQTRAPSPVEIPTPATNRQATLETSDLVEFASQPASIQALLTDALALTKQGLVYKYGSDDPKNGGMDCSGTVNYLLHKEGLTEVPREASTIYKWAWEANLFQAVNSTDPHSFEFAQLRPGDLLFWTGTYSIQRDPPITHVMIYLGTEKKTGQRVMFGASEGRRYGGMSRYGVSVFEFTMPGFPPPTAYTAGTARFVGYAAIPGLPKRETAEVPPATTPSS